MIVAESMKQRHLVNLASFQSANIRKDETELRCSRRGSNEAFRVATAKSHDRPLPIFGGDFVELQGLST